MVHSKENESTVEWKDFCEFFFFFKCKILFIILLKTKIVTPISRRGMSIGITLMMLNIFTGPFILINYSASIFKFSGSNMDPNNSAIIMMCVQLIGTYVSTFIVDKFGRRILMMVSSMGASFGLATVGTFTFLASKGYDLVHVNWVPVICLSGTVFFLSLGIMPLYLVILAEVLPSKVFIFIIKISTILK